MLPSLFAGWLSLDNRYRADRTITGKNIIPWDKSSMMIRERAVKTTQKIILKSEGSLFRFYDIGTAIFSFPQHFVDATDGTNQSNAGCSLSDDVTVLGRLINYKPREIIRWLANRVLIPSNIKCLRVMLTRNKSRCYLLRAITKFTMHLQSCSRYTVKPVFLQHESDFSRKLIDVNKKARFNCVKVV